MKRKAYVAFFLTVWAYLSAVTFNAVMVANGR